MSNYKSNNQVPAKTKEQCMKEIKAYMLSDDVFATFRDSFAAVTTEAQKKAATHAVSTILAHVENYKPKEGGKFLWQCTPKSIAAACMSGILAGCPVDSRQLAYLVPYNDEVQYQIGWRGFVKRIRESYQNAVLKVGIVFEGEHFEWSDQHTGARFTHTVADGSKMKPRSWDVVQHVYFFVEYMVGGRWFSFIEVMDKRQIIAVKNKAASGSMAWKDFYEEQSKKAVIKRASKTHFAGILDDIIQYDNEANYDLDKEGEEEPGEIQNATTTAQDMFAREQAILEDKRPEQQTLRPQPVINFPTTEKVEVISGGQQPSATKAENQAGMSTTPPVRNNTPLEGEWNGTFKIHGKLFTTPGAAPDGSAEDDTTTEMRIQNGAAFFLKCLERQKTKASCIALMDENPGFIRALVALGQAGADEILHFHNIADSKKGEQDGSNNTDQRGDDTSGAGSAEPDFQ